jgi:hypothetical protein
MLDRDIDCRRMGSGSERLAAAIAAAAEVEAEVEVGVAEVAPDRLAAEAGTEAGSSNTCPSLYSGHQARSVKDRCCQTPYLLW